jgi:hypothetical protein
MSEPEPDAGDVQQTEQLDPETAENIRRQWDDRYWSRSPTPRYRP